MTHKGWRVVKPEHNPHIVRVCESNIIFPPVCLSCYLLLTQLAEFNKTCGMASPLGKGVQEQHYFSVRHTIGNTGTDRGDFVMACHWLRLLVWVWIELDGSQIFCVRIERDSSQIFCVRIEQDGSQIFCVWIELDGSQIVCVWIELEG